MTLFRSALAGPAIALLLLTLAGGAGAEPAPAPPTVVPAKADEGPKTFGPLPVAQTQQRPQDDQKADADGSTSAPPEEPESMAGTMFRTLLVLAAVVALIYLTLNFGLRRLMGIKGMPGTSGVVQVVERIPLDPKRTLFVVKAAGEYLLLGGADQHLTLISKLDQEAVTALLDQQKRNALAPSPFLQKLLNKPPSEKV